MEIILVIFYFASFFILWFGAGLIIKGVDQLSRKLNLSSFSVSFFVLGLLTSTPEFSLGINAIIAKNPEIFVGNLIGGSVTLLLLVIPLLAIFGNGIKLCHQLDEKNLIFSLLVIITPIFFIADNLITRTEAAFLILIYGILVYFIEKKKGLLERVKDEIFSKETHLFEDLGKIFLGITIIFLTSRFIVVQTIKYANILKAPLFLVSLLVLSVGTNLPELSLAIRSILSRRKEIAFGDYLGSASANSFFFGILTFLNNQRINVSHYSKITLILVLFSFFLFFLFSKSKKEISKEEGIILLLTYLLFVLVETAL